jgi:hypothetical protein
MKRRTLLRQLPALVAAPALAQSPAGAKLLVLLSFFTPSSMGEYEAVVRQELARLGWRLGDNLRLESRYADNMAVWLRTLQKTAELLRGKPVSLRAISLRSELQPGWRSSTMR